MLLVCIHPSLVLVVVVVAVGTCVSHDNRLGVHGKYAYFFFVVPRWVWVWVLSLGFPTCFLGGWWVMCIDDV